MTRLGYQIPNFTYPGVETDGLFDAVARQAEAADRSGFEALGFEFGTFTDRFEKLEEALQIIIPMLRDERPTVAGRHYQVTNAVNQPPPLGRIPVMIGGAGEKKTLRMVAQYADESNLLATPSEVPRKLDALASHCQRLGRDRSEITVSLQRTVCIAPTHEQAEADLTRFLRDQRGIDLDAADDATRRMIEERITVGDPSEAGEKLAAILDLGVDGFTCNLPANGHNPENVALLGETATKLLN